MRWTHLEGRNNLAFIWVAFFFFDNYLVFQPNKFWEFMGFKPKYLERTNPGVLRTNSGVFRTKPGIFKTNPVLFRTNTGEHRTK